MSTVPSKYDDIQNGLMDTVNEWRTNVPQVYGPSGLITNPKIWVGTTTTDSSGTWQVDITSANFSSILSVNASTFSSGSSAITETICAPNTITVEAVFGVVIRGLNALLASPTVRYAGDSVEVNVCVIGT